MKKIILLIICFVLALTGVAFADVCVMIQRKTNSDLSPNEVNQLTDEELIEYNARVQPWDIMTAYDASRCQFEGEQNPDSYQITVIVRGLDLADALPYWDTWREPTGETDPETGEALTYIKRTKKHNIANGNLPGPVKNLFDDNSYLEFQWVDICGFVTNKFTDITGAVCP